MNTPLPIAGLVSDPLLNTFKDNLRKALVEVRWFAANPYESLMLNSRDYAAWHNKVLNTPKKFVKWILPLWTRSTARKVAHEVFGREKSPVKELGEHPVTRYIRYLVFKRHRSYETITHLLIDKFGWDKNSARSATHRVAKSERERNLAIWMEELQKFPGMCDFFKQVKPN